MADVWWAAGLPLDPVVHVAGGLGLEGHAVFDGQDALGRFLARVAFGQFAQRAGFRNDGIDQLATHGLGDSAQAFERDAVFRFGALEGQGVLASAIHSPADLFQS